MGTSFVELIGLAVLLFASTNVDDVFVLLGFFADPQFRGRQVVVGQFLGIGTLYAASVLASFLSLVIAPAYIGVLGLAPIGLGLKKLWELRKGSEPRAEVLEGPRKVLTARSNVLAVAVVTVSNGGDNISIYTPLFATWTGFEIAIIGAVFAAMTALWLGAAHWLTHHRTIGAPIRRYGHRLVPFVLIALGLLILHEAGTFGLLWAA